ncbi:propionate catabolism operon regulatory protein PrpR [Pseudomonas schmalbachii]|uniref:Propionate catabolism operon regulatory protein PrpR n=1 Tax=Pseudomonas schmalbachii TaxID=2816993 RepID=A0ABS3TPE7_9PSED|nr:propionate catabolism operon regulatory protein PrpR [Pseudomonas schmalbachii]MBO3275539.1 propionate catabolism operon regulatory protein PrpR [Pseudomonas schmalbachii]
MSVEHYLPRVVVLITHRRQPQQPSRMARIIQQALPDFHGRARIEIVETTLTRLLDEARELESNQRADIFICSGASADYLRQNISTSVLSIHMGEFDLIRALDLARTRATRVGILSFRHTYPELAALQSLFTVAIREATYASFEEARQQVQLLASEGYRVIVGSSTVVQLADEAGVQGVLALNVDSIRRALDNALSICRSRVQSLIQQQRLNAVMRNLSDGVIAVDADGLVQSLNPRMATLLEISADWARGRPLREVMPALEPAALPCSSESQENQLIRIGTKTLAANLTPIIEDGKTDGMVITCREANAIQRADRHIRSLARPRHFTARYRFEQILGDAPAFRETVHLAQLYAQTDSTVLITGESGTGKELLAQSLHNASARQQAPFVAINCAAFPESLLESELFGYEEGAFTGSRKGGKIGLIEAAHTGTLFLDEIGDMPVSLQTRLLRVLQEREVLRLGASEPTPVDLRVVAATHCDLRTRIADGRFREDLFYRLNILRLVVPPLRQRAQDIPMLVNGILGRLSRAPGMPRFETIALPRLMPYLIRHRWPGNIRELENIVERAAISAQVLEGSDRDDSLRTLFPELFEDEHAGFPVSIEPATDDLRSLGKAAEAAHARQVLGACEGNLDETARRLGVSRTTLWRRLRAGRSH